MSFNVIQFLLQDWDSVPCLRRRILEAHSYGISRTDRITCDTGIILLILFCKVSLTHKHIFIYIHNVLLGQKTAACFFFQFFFLNNPLDKTIFSNVIHTIIDMPIHGSNIFLGHSQLIKRKA